MARRGREDWFGLVREQESSGLSISEFCRRKKLTENSFYRWRRLLAEDKGASFVPLEVVGTRAVDITLPCGATVNVAADRKALQEVFAALLSVEVGDA